MENTDLNSLLLFDKPRHFTTANNEKDAPPVGKPTIRSGVDPSHGGPDPVSGYVVAHEGQSRANSHQAGFFEGRRLGRRTSAGARLRPKR